MVKYKFMEKNTLYKYKIKFSFEKIVYYEWLYLSWWKITRSKPTISINKLLEEQSRTGIYTNI